MSPFGPKYAEVRALEQHAMMRQLRTALGESATALRGSFDGPALTNASQLPRHGKLGSDRPGDGDRRPRT